MDDEKKTFLKKVSAPNFAGRNRFVSINARIRLRSSRDKNFNKRTLIRRPNAKNCLKVSVVACCYEYIARMPRMAGTSIEPDHTIKNVNYTISNSPITNCIETKMMLVSEVHRVSVSSVPACLSNHSNPCSYLAFFSAAAAAH